MFTTPAPAPPTVSATPISTTSTASNSPRSSGLRGGLSFLRNYAHGLHAHSASSAPGSREDPRAAPASSLRDPRARSRAATTASSSTPPASPSYTSFAGSSSHLSTDHSSGDLARVRSEPQNDPSAAPTMTRTRSETAAPQLAVRNHNGPTPASTPALPTMDGSDAATDGAAAMKHLPSIRFIPHQDPRAGRPSLQFPTITRTLPDESAIIRVGRYSERDNLPDVPTNVPSAAAVGFKSKVVSRKHCELWCKDGNWYIKDVKSSSGTFLNHIRLSQPNVESKPFRIKDGDIIQLGIDFRGGEEMIFRCVKIRVECNRGWQQGLNNFNKQTHQRLRNLGKAKKDSDTASTHTSECVICLMSIAPCQSLFVAPCSHVWHYKCIRPILNGPTWPNFLCPNCRAVADLEADAEDPGDFEEWDDDVVQTNGDSPANGQNSQEDRHVTPRASTVPLNGEATQLNGQFSLSDLQAAISNMGISDSLNGIANQPVPNPETPQRFTSPAASSSVTQPVAISVSGSSNDSGLSPVFQTASHGLTANHAPECPMTPRNDAGPFVLDGSAGRAAGSRLRDGESPNTNSNTAPTLPPLDID